MTDPYPNRHNHAEWFARLEAIIIADICQWDSFTIGWYQDLLRTIPPQGDEPDRLRFAQMQMLGIIYGLGFASWDDVMVQYGGRRIRTNEEAEQWDI